MAGQWWRCKKLRREAGGTDLFLLFNSDDFGKKEVIDFWRKGVMPLMFQEKIRMVLVLVGVGATDDGGCTGSVGTEWHSFRLLVGGGLISRSIATRGWCALIAAYKCEVKDLDSSMTSC